MKKRSEKPCLAQRRKYAKGAKLKQNFWLRPQMLIGESVEDFIAYWQTKRDRTQRGIVEVIT